MFVQACDYHSLISSLIPQELSALIFQESLIGFCSSLIYACYTAIVFWESAYFIFPVPGLQVSLNTFAF